MKHNRKKYLNDICFCFNIDATLVHQVKNDSFKTRHHSDHDPIIVEIKSRVRQTFKLVKSKTYDQEEFSY